MIEVSNLVKQYGDHYAVDHLSFTVEEGEVLGFLVPNGAGKSTTMNIITGYISATEGTVTINGHDILDEPEEAKKCMGYLPEIPPVYPEMTVKEYLNFVAEIKGVKKEDRFDDVMNAMEMTKITNYQNRLIRHLSKGYRQRTGIAGAMIGNPDIIILDEPTVGLDPSQIIEVRDLIRSLAKDHTIILSSHIMQEISAVCDRVLIINKGKMIVNDSIKDLSKKMSGSNRLELKLKADAEEAKQMLLAIDEVESVDVVSKEDGIIDLHVYSQDTDVREKVFLACAATKTPIYGMSLIEMTLEEIFIKLIANMEKEKEEA
ncbi:MAG: ABC transporter ATP-binding protein [Lachnospiraceae bacterium]|nr:ABC transporter ATP-binding protein [Lachnospiraceae bacterium]